MTNSNEECIRTNGKAWIMYGRAVRAELQHYSGRNDKCMDELLQDEYRFVNVDGMVDKYGSDPSLLDACKYVDQILCDAAQSNAELNHP